MKEPMNISEARGRLPELARRVTSEAGAVEYIGHRDLPEDLALTSASHLEFLRATVQELKRRMTTPFTLAGSISSRLPDEELEAALAAARLEQADRATSRLGEFVR
jgi:hypothetical protein